jgi:hypothetical protein
MIIGTEDELRPEYYKREPSKRNLRPRQKYALY